MRDISRVYEKVVFVPLSILVPTPGASRTKRFASAFYHIFVFVTFMRCLYLSNLPDTLLTTALITCCFLFLIRTFIYPSYLVSSVVALGFISCILASSGSITAEVVVTPFDIIFAVLPVPCGVLSPRCLFWEFTVCSFLYTSVRCLSYSPLSWWLWGSVCLWHPRRCWSFFH